MHIALEVKKVILFNIHFNTVQGARKRNQQDMISFLKEFNRQHDRYANMSFILLENQFYLQPSQEQPNITHFILSVIVTRPRPDNLDKFSILYFLYLKNGIRSLILSHGAMEKKRWGNIQQKRVQAATYGLKPHMD